MSMHTVTVIWRGATWWHADQHDAMEPHEAVKTCAVERRHYFGYPSFSAHVHYPHFHLEKESKPTGSSNSLLPALTFVVQWRVWRGARAVAFCWIIWVWGSTLFFWQAEVVRCDFLIAFKIPEGTCGKKRRENEICASYRSVPLYSVSSWDLLRIDFKYKPFSKSTWIISTKWQTSGDMSYSDTIAEQYLLKVLKKDLTVSHHGPHVYAGAGEGTNNRKADC